MIIKYLLPIALLSAAATASAMPARPGRVTVSQPDGTRVELTLHGDEHSHWATTPDGYTLLADRDGYWAFAELRAGRAVASTVRYMGDDRQSVGARGIERQIKVNSSDYSPKAANVTQIEGTFPSTGKRKLLMILLNYADTQPIYTQADFESYMNGENHGGVGSFRDYYLENSYGKLDITTTVSRWVTLPYAKSHYGSEGAGEMIIEALRILDSEIDYSEFDNDGDGILDGLAVIHQGTGAEASGSSYDIWSHSSSLSGVSYDGIHVNRYTIQPEILYTDDGSKRQSTIGVMCHEFGHNLGAPDFYDTDYQLSGGDFPGTGSWDLMGSGAWNGSQRDGTRPAGTNMWQKIQLGWVTPEILDSSRDVRNMPGSTYHPVAYRFDTTIPGEYFVLENRQQEGFDLNVPGHGLIIYHVDEARISSTIGSNNVNISAWQGIYTVCAGASTVPGDDPASFGWVNSTAAPFPGAMNKTSFTDTTVPSTKSNTGRDTYKGLVYIAEDTEAGTINFDFICYEAPASPVALKAKAVQGDIELSWEAPEGEAPAKYNVFRNNKHIATVTDTGYIDTTVGNLTELTYAVDCEYASGVISPYSTAEIILPGNHIASFDAMVDGSDVTLSWGLNRKLSRMPDTTTEAYYEHEYYYDKMEIANLYRADDLSIYRGYKINQIAFFPLQGPREISCRLTVYGIDKAGTRTVLSQRNVSEIGNMQWNTVKLTKSVEITGECDIMIAVQITSNTGAIRLLSDRSAAIDGYGNLSAINGGEMSADSKLRGNHFLYAVLTEPAAEERDMPQMTAVEDSRADLVLPLGFTVYRDGEAIGTTGGRLFVDSNVAPGTHRYTVTNLYKGNNESAAVAKEVTIEGESSIVGVDDEAPAFDVMAAEGGIIIRAASPVNIYNIAGVLLKSMQPADNETFVPLAAGVYLVEGTKVLVK